MHCKFIPEHRASRTVGLVLHLDAGRSKSGLCVGVSERANEPIIPNSILDDPAVSCARAHNRLRCAPPLLLAR